MFLNILNIAGTCEIRFDASGKFASENTAQYWFDPTVIRHMAGWVIDQCVGGDKTGGYVTNGISPTMNYLSARSTNIFAALRKLPPHAVRLAVAGYW